MLDSTWQPEMALAAAPRHNTLEERQARLVRAAVRSRACLRQVAKTSKISAVQVCNGFPTCVTAFLLM